MELEQQQHQLETEKLVGEMLNFLESSSDDDEMELVGGQPNQDVPIMGQPERDIKQTIKIEEKLETTKDMGESETNIKLPIWNTREIVTNRKKSHSLSLSPFQESSGVKQQSIWRPHFLNHMEKISFPTASGNDTKTTQHTQHVTDCNNNTIPNKIPTDICNDAYSQEIRKAVYGEISDHPVPGSKEYYDAAQNYAIYGKDFLDFPKDLSSLMGKKLPTGRDMGTYSTTSALGQQLPPVAVGSGYNLNENNTTTQLDANNFGKPPQINTSMATYGISTTNSPVGSTTSTSTTFYQMGSSITSQFRPVTGSNTSPATPAGATAYGMFLGNKITYVPTPTSTSCAPTMVYNQQASHASTNFISNSLANAALTASPAILYSNPMLTSAAQHYLNAFIKETHMLNNANNTATAAGSPSQISTSAIYERLVYAQMLQQQIYHQSQQQQAVMVGAMLHKQRINAAAALAAVNAARQGTATTTTGAAGATNIGQGGTQSGTNLGGPVGTSTNMNTCSRQASAAATILTNPSNQSAVKANISDDSSCATKD
ncbi:uncharacterized protein [Musca autumnalis]|uniref:uncharacterized protein n=1 Tax=Musca autumnalis TaxID=221902 RepID=UPI003CF710DB